MYPVAEQIFRQLLMQRMAGTITNTELALVISNKPGAYALERAKRPGFHRKSLFQKITKTGMLLEKH